MIYLQYSVHPVVTEFPKNDYDYADVTLMA